MKGNIKKFIAETFEYYDTLMNCAIDRSVDPYFLEYIADGLAAYDGVDGFINNMHNWMKKVMKIYPELKYDHKSHIIHAVIDLKDQIVVVDHNLYEDLKVIIDVLKKYGLLIKFNEKGSKTKATTTLSRFFEEMQKHYPRIKDRYKGLGSSDADVSKEIILDPKTRRLIQVTMDNPQTEQQLGILTGDGKYNIAGRKELLATFKFDKTMIDN